MLVHPHDGAERSEVGLHLLPDRGLLDLDGDPLAPISGLESCAMHLGDARAGDGVLLELGKDTVRAARGAAELCAEDAVDVGVGDLGRVVEEACEFALDGTREEGGVGADCLAFECGRLEQKRLMKRRAERTEFDVEAAVGGEEVEDALTDALVEGGDPVRCVWGEVELVVDRNHRALAAES